MHICKKLRKIYGGNEIPLKVSMNAIQVYFDGAQTPPSSPVWMQPLPLPLAHQVLILPPGPLELCEKFKKKKKKENVLVNISGAGFMAVLSHGVMTGLVLA